jgi:hypothetical protein
MYRYMVYAEFFGRYRPTPVSQAAILDYRLDVFGTETPERAEAGAVILKQAVEEHYQLDPVAKKSLHRELVTVAPLNEDVDYNPYYSGGPIAAHPSATSVEAASLDGLSPDAMQTEPSASSGATGEASSAERREGKCYLCGPGSPYKHHLHECQSIACRQLLFCNQHSVVVANLWPRPKLGDSFVSHAHRTWTTTTISLTTKMP